MGRVICMINLTADGFADGKYVNTDAEFYEFVHGLLAETSTVAYGANTFQLFQSLWPPRLEDKNTPEYRVKMAKALHNIHKAVYSSTLKTTTWNNSTIVTTVEAEEINTYKQKDKKGLLTIGSLGLVASLTAMDLVDDYYFCIHPIIAGNGEIRLFDRVNLDTTRSLKYEDSQQLKNGTHIIHYTSNH
ncbi:MULTISPECIES: dihydrofolate reductase family protein [Niastella]|uniref:Dihydrofolate reductase family protein n=1 Tax=Niastella soli TaxID=2821487 RepID=A0ABS3Z5V4_9BACT|nr:dihydrofolate reductase family protein [Niastella soli]MBO9205423.1 dihydrofolate reductase family protein [Niastella soli]